MHRDPGDETDYDERKKINNAKYYLKHKEQLLAYGARYYQEHKEEIVEQHADWRLRNPNRHRKELYNLTQTQFDALMLVQCGMCAICTKLLDRPYVDHDHETGKVRGLLCRNCNTGLGMFQDSSILLVAAGEYIGENT